MAIFIHQIIVEKVKNLLEIEKEEIKQDDKRDNKHDKLLHYKSFNIP